MYTYSFLVLLKQYNKVPYSREQKHVLLFRKSALRGCYKPRHVTKQDVLLLATIRYPNC